MCKLSTVMGDNQVKITKALQILNVNKINIKPHFHVHENYLNFYILLITGSGWRLVCICPVTIPILTRSHTR